MAIFSLICEGISESNMITNLIQRYVNGASVLTIQPEINDNKQGNWGGFREVVSHCTDRLIADSLKISDFIVIQIDTDMYKDYLDNAQDNWTDAELYDKIRERLLRDVSAEYHEKIIFAICFNETECWFLPFFWSSQKKAEDIEKQCTNNCVFKINKELKSGYKIDMNHEKNSDNSRRAYDEIFKILKSQKKSIKDFSKYNYGFKKFIEQIDDKIQQ